MRKPQFYMEEKKTTTAVVMPLLYVNALLKLTNAMP